MLVLFDQRMNKPKDEYKTATSREDSCESNYNCPHRSTEVSSLCRNDHVTTIRTDRRLTGL